jgi:peptidoglycan/xylan/chitin deacetylase (PgdA/CDA1 family)
MYHRIADEPIDPWDLAVPPARFEEHVHVLRRTRRPFRLTEFVQGLLAGTLPPDAVALTFDDGYVDNLLAAKPRLASAEVPATVFLATGFLNRREPFWWDELTRFILLEDGSPSFDIVVNRKKMHIDLDELPLSHSEISRPALPSVKRRAALMMIWRSLRSLDDEERKVVMRSLRSKFSASNHQCRAMTSAEVQAIAADGLVTIGAHTVTHPVLPELGTVACRREIVDSKLTCEALIGAPVTSFAYPYGDFNAGAREEVRNAGFTLACSTRHGPATTTSDVFALPRIYVRNCDGDAFERALRSASTAR